MVKMGRIFRRNFGDVRFPSGSPQNPIKLGSISFIRTCPCGLEVKFNHPPSDKEVFEKCVKRCAEFERKTKGLK